MIETNWLARTTAALTVLAASACTDAPLPTATTPSDADRVESPVLMGTGELLVADPFEREVTPGWGTADLGGAWRIDSGHVPHFRVTGGRGLVVAPDHRPRNVIATEGYGLDVEGLVSFSIDTPPDRSSRYYKVQVYARRNDAASDGDNYYRFQIRAYGNGTMRLQAEKNVRGSITELTGEVGIDATWGAGRRYWVRWDAVGVSPATRLRFRVWEAGTPEPASWPIDVTVDEPALDHPGTTGMRVEGPNANQTTFPITFSFDDLRYARSGEAANRAPTADPGGPYSGRVGSDVRFDGSGSSDPNGEALTYHWDFGDGTTGSGVSPTHAYAAVDTYTVTLTVTDERGLASDPATTTVAVTQNGAPVADPGGPYAGEPGLAILFDGSGSSDPEGGALSYAWDFGDGNAGSGSAPSHTYAAAGTYTVTLVVTDADGASSTPATTTAEVATTSTGGDLVVDGFSRTVSDGWGAAEMGGVWRVGSSQHQSNFRTADGMGLIVSPDNKPRHIIPSEGYGLDVSGLVSFAIDTPPDRSSRFYTVQVYARRNDLVTDGDNYYRFTVRTYGSGDTQLRVEKNVAGSISTLNSFVSAGVVWQAGRRYWIRWEAVGSSPSTRLRMRVWADGSAEPAGWTVDLAVDEPALDVPGTTGIRVEGPNADQTTFPITFSFDDLRYGEG